MVDAPISVTSIDETPLVFDFSSPNVGETPYCMSFGLRSHGFEINPMCLCSFHPIHAIFGGQQSWAGWMVQWPARQLLTPSDTVWSVCLYAYIYIHTYTIYMYRKPIHSHMVTEATRQTCHPFPNFIEKKGGVFPLGSRVARGGATLRHDLSRLCWLCSLLLGAMSFPDLCLTYG